MQCKRESGSWGYDKENVSLVMNEVVTWISAGTMWMCPERGWHTCMGRDMWAGPQCGQEVERITEGRERLTKKKKKRKHKTLQDIIVSTPKENKAPIIPLDTPTPTPTGTHMLALLQGHEVILGLLSTKRPGR